MNGCTPTHRSSLIAHNVFEITHRVGPWFLRTTRAPRRLAAILSVPDRVISAASDRVPGMVASRRAMSPIMTHQDHVVGVGEVAR